MKIKKAKSRKKDAIKRKLKFEDSRHCLEAKEKIELMQIILENIMKTS